MKTDPKAKCTTEEFIKLYTTVGPTELAKRTKQAVRSVMKRRISLEKQFNIVIKAQEGATSGRPPQAEHPQRAAVEVKDGIVLVGSDAHIWPGLDSVAMRAFIQFCKGVDGEKPKAVILNGDVLDFPGVSRHPPIGWETLPAVSDEIEAAKVTLGKIEAAAFKARKIWTLGNHDARFETRLATVAPEYAKINGVHLRDHFPLWEPCWSAWVNDSTVVKHRFKGGVHAVYNNAVYSGKHILTGHLHSAKVTPFTDYNGTRYGVDTGCLSSVQAKAFVDYSEDNPKNWISAFAVLTYRDGKLLWPELVSVYDTETVQFRGKLLKV